MTANTKARWIISTEANPWQESTQEVVALAEAPDVFVQLDQPKQVIEGFGASFNELGWTSLAKLTDSDRAAIIRDFFEPGVGLNFNLCRMPLGANDFSRDWYSYDETAGDLALEHFSIANDLETLVPFIKAAKAHQPNLKLWASPWSPPSWMKVNGHYAGAMPHPWMNQEENGLREDQVGAEGTDMFKLDDAHLSAYANYFGKFIDAYNQLGIEISMVMPQNEFNSAQVFPSCTWTPEGLAKFVGHLGPQMRKRSVEVFLGTLERGDETMVEKVLSDEHAGPFIAGLGAQWAGKFAIDAVHKAHPDLRIYQTEQECGDGLNDWRYARYAWGLMKRFFGAGANAYTYWNMSLLEGGRSRWGWHQNSLVVVDEATGAWRFSHEYYLLKHVSNLVAVGARYIPTMSYTGFENQIVFQNPDGSLVLVMQNDLKVPVSVRVMLGNRMIKPTLPADSFSTFVIEA